MKKFIKVLNILLYTLITLALVGVLVLSVTGSFRTKGSPLFFIGIGTISAFSISALVKEIKSFKE